MTHALRIRRPMARTLLINILRTSNAVYVLEKTGKPACAGTKVATVDHERTRPECNNLCQRSMRGRQFSICFLQVDCHSKRQDPSLTPRRAGEPSRHLNALRLSMADKTYAIRPAVPVCVFKGPEAHKTRHFHALTVGGP
jgi:hypothetical protein